MSNKGFFLFAGERASGLIRPTASVTADFFELLAAYGIYRVTRLDIQQTVETTRYLTPWWIKGFDSGCLRVIGKRYYEPRGRKSFL